MRNFNPADLDEITKLVATDFIMIEFLFDTTYRFTNCDIPLYYNGNKYGVTPPFKLTPTKSNTGFKIDKLTIRFSNVLDQFSPIVLNEDVLNKNVIVYHTFVGHDNYNILATYEYFRGFVMEWTDLTEQSINFIFGNEFMLWKKRTLRTPSISCPWVFKGVECTYTGEEDACDRSADRCKALDNYEHFGGRAFIEGIEEKEIYWGAK